MVVQSYNKLLGVCIPTYRRPDWLRKCVNSIVAGAAPFNVPIFIADDSEDHTNDEAIAELKARYRWVFCSPNSKNLGIDRNILKAVSLCECRYAWLLGEDDQMHPLAISRIISLLESDATPPAFICVNYSAIDASGMRCLRERTLALDFDLTVPARTFVEEFAWASGFIGACIVETERWRQVDSQKYLGTYFAHLGVICEYIANLEVAIVAEPLVQNRCGSPSAFSWSGATFDVMEGFAAVMERLRPIFGEETCLRGARRFSEAHHFGTLRFLCYARAGGAYGQAEYRRVVAGSGRPVAFKAIAKGLTVVPPRLLRCLQRFKTLSTRGDGTFR